MNKLISRGLWGVLLVGGLSLLGATAANAAAPSGPETGGDDGTASGTQGILSINLPITIGGNSLSILGSSSSTSTPASPPASAPAPAPGILGGITSGLGALLGGTQAVADVTVPVTVSGNAISLLGTSSATSAAPAPAAAATAPATPATTSGTDGILSGTQLAADVAAPVTVSGNAIGILGTSVATGTSPAVPAQASSLGILPGLTGGGLGILSGTQLLPSLSLPITLSGNAIAVLGDSTVTGPTAGTGTDAPDPTEETPGTDDPTPGDTTTVASPGGTAVAALPTTGTESGGIAAIGALLLLAGAWAVASTRRRALRY